MRLRACPRERDVNEMLALGQWPQACGDELRTHVAGCRSCRELVLVREAFGRDRNHLMNGAAARARIDSPGALWWRAQLRRRNAAIKRISRPLLGAQIFAFAVCLAAAVGYVLWFTRRGFDFLGWMGELPRALHLGALVPGSLTNSPWAIWFGISVGALLALTGGVIALLKSEKR